MGSLKALRRAAFERQHHRCHYCGVQMWESGGDPLPQLGRPRLLQCTAEHLHARCDGGADRADNIVAACRFCNERRHQRAVPLTPAAYLQHVARRLAQRRWHPAFIHAARLLPNRSTAAEPAAMC